jgi:small-conductance mechanosensitive channel
MFNLIDFFQSVLHTNLFTAEILSSIVLFAGVGLVGWIFYFIFGHYFSNWAKKTQTTLDDKILAATKSFVIIIIILLGINFAITPLSVLQPYRVQLAQVFDVIEILLVAFAITRISDILLDWYTNKQIGMVENGKNTYHLSFLMKKVVQLIVYICALLIIVFGVFNATDFTGAVVGLGVGGIAIAFAVQNQLGDILGTFSIYFDRPFEIGDFIVVGDYSGTVKSIGIRSTRITLLQGEELVISNRELTSASVRNFRKLEKRRVTFIMGVEYDTPLVKLKKIPGIIGDIIKNVPTADLDRVNFTEFGDFSLKFLVIYYVNSPDYGNYLETQQTINFAIKEAFEQEGIGIALPTSSIYLKK